MTFPIKVLRPHRVTRLKVASSVTGILIATAVLLGSSRRALSNVSPVLVTNVATSGAVGAVVLSGHYLYCVGDAFTILDVSNSAAPIQVGAANLPGGGSGLAVSGTSAFILTGELHNVYPATLSIFDVSKPANPVKVGEISGGWTSVAASGPYVYLGYVYFGGGGLSIYDVSDPSNPASVGHVDFVTFGRIASIVVRSNYAYMAVDGGTGLVVCDVSDPAYPTKVGQANSAASGMAYDVAVSADFAYIAASTNGLGIYNVANPTNPVSVANSMVNGLSVAVSGNYVYMVDGDETAIFNASNPTNASLALFENILPYAGTCIQAHMITVSSNHAYVGTYDGLRVYCLGEPEPVISISSTATHVLLSWPAPTGAFAVQQNLDLNPAHWTTITSTPIFIDGENQVSVPKENGTMFYRLISM